MVERNNHTHFPEIMKLWQNRKYNTFFIHKTLGINLLRTVIFELESIIDIEIMQP